MVAMRALVTGAGGFIGANVVRALLGRGYEVRALVRPGAEVANLRGLAVGVNTKKIEAIERFIREKLQPILTVSFKEMAHFGTMDEKKILETILAGGSGDGSMG